jgi:hypothetical protein
MPDPIAAAFTGNWRLQLAPAKGGELALVQVMIAQQAWRQLTRPSRSALLAISETPGRTVHHATRDCLRRHGLVDEHNHLTRSGRLVVRHRPVQTSTPNRIAGRPVIDVHLPDPAPAEVST